ncbi:peroxisomal trans-2-enoyl-CoA reductase isoform X3 [Eurytemora carolleeae]|uniref:peroxisomal trans-2-enoyl-CoA reductase isoform X2 n=1 Tax=Eurytemora carolleeae TaxID=1294199 RepID=UPI000C75CA4F|nr:peroxisomal trans-2-enoyl-CoA reductase isoform X2 [Eurytemora carolleeae]XP_023320392.1 peroxisomal trans-2-enoyl-CoA reductase isoform X3 [Eurytemora carolleeae]|eukprot:XP_023320391.1 peroxisomal trans-2-enoyl-CoA reductase-like isoform X2 [Eurytemora affinis]
MSIFRSGLFKDKVAIVTGGGTGIGKAISEELLVLGARVVIASRNQDKVADAAKELCKLGDVTSFRCNIRKEEDVKTLVKNTLDKYGRIDYLVNNGGGQFPCPAADMSLKGWNAVIETNLTGTYLMSREVYNQYFKDHGGVVVNIIADMFRGFPMMSHTGAARAGVENLTKSLSIEWAENGVRVNAISPGVIFSNTAQANYDTDIFEMSRPKLPFKRLGEPREVSSAVCFLLSPGSQFISGATLRVDGGGSLYSPLMWKIDEHKNIPSYSWDPYKSKL